MALRAAQPVPLYRFLIGGDNAFAVQSLEHPDGWGIAYNEQGLPCLVKSVLPAITDQVFEELAFSVKSDSVLAHVRRATAGVVARRNCHPFRHGAWVFAHNGTIARHDEVRDELLTRVSPALRATVEGETDAEVFFLLFLTRLERHASLDDRRPPTAALVEALSSTITEIRKVADSGSDEADPVSSLTCILTSGELMMGLSAGKPLAVRCSGDEQSARQVMFSSEAISTPGIIRERFPWRDLLDGEYLLVDGDLATESGTL